MSLKSKKRTERSSGERTQNVIAAKTKKKGAQFWITVFVLSVFFIGAVVFLPDKDEVLSRVISALVCAAALFTCLNKKNWSALAKAANPLSVSVLLYALVCFVSTFWAAASKIALYEYIKPVTAAAGFVVVTAFLAQGEENLTKLVKWTAAGLAVLSLLSVDAASSGFFTYPLKLLTNGKYGIFETGVRISSILNAPNVFAPMAAIGVFLSFFLIKKSEASGEKLFASACFALNAAALILTFSLGALGVFALSALVFIFMLPREKRGLDFLLAIALLIVCAVISAVSFVFLGKGGVLSFVPVVLLAVSCAAVFGVVLLSEKLSFKALNIKTGLVITAAIAVAVVYLAAAFLITTPYSLKEGDTLYRAFYPKAGEYELNIEADGEVNVEIQLQDANQIYSHTYSQAYFGGVSQSGGKVSFTVPEGTRIAKLYLSSNGAKVTKVRAKGEREYDIPLKYPLLPSFAVTRLQGLFENQNAIQRFAFYRDGLKLFMQNPLTGVGAGGFWARSMEIQEYYYESRYVHNHYIQTMTEAGIFGMLSFLAILVSSVYLLAKKVKKEGGGYVSACLAACLCMMFLHAAVEVDFSVNPFINLAFVILAVVSQTSGWERKNKKLERVSDNLVRVPAVLLSAVTLLVLTGNFAAYNITNNLQKSAKPFDDLRLCIALDPYNGDTYRLAYVVNNAYSQEPVAEVVKYARRYEKKLKLSKSFEIINQLENMYFKTGDIESGFKTSLKYLKLVRKDPDAWRGEFNYYENLLSGDNLSRLNNSMMTERAINGVMSAYSQLRTENNGAPYKVALSDKNLLFIMRMMTVQSTGGSIGKTVSRVAFDSASTVDTDADGKNDLVSYDGGIQGIEFDKDKGLLVSASAPGSIKLKTDVEKSELVLVALACDNAENISGVTVSGVSPGSQENIAGQQVLYFENVEKADEIVISVKGDVTISSIAATK